MQRPPTLSRHCSSASSSPADRMRGRKPAAARAVVRSRKDRRENDMVRLQVRICNRPGRPALCRDNLSPNMRAGPPVPRGTAAGRNSPSHCILCRIMCHRTTESRRTYGTPFQPTGLCHAIGLCRLRPFRPPRCLHDLSGRHCRRASRHCIFLKDFLNRICGNCRGT